MNSKDNTPNKKPHLKWFNSLRTRFILSITGILIVIFALVAFFLIDNVHNTLTGNLNRETTAFASLSASPIGNSYQTYSQSGSLLISQQMQNFTTLDSDVSNVAIVGLDGHSVFSLDGNPVSIPASEASNFTSSTKKNSQGQVVQLVQPYFDSSGQHSYAIVYTVSTESLNQTISREELLVLIFTVLAIFISALFSYLFINGLFLSPIGNLSKSAGQIASGGYDQQIRSSRSDEIGTLATSLNQMADSLKADINKLEEVDKLKTEFITIASHNLRTPIAIIQGYVDILKRSNPDQATQSAVNAIDNSTTELSEFSEQMLTISDVDSIRNPLLLTETTLPKLLQPLADDFTDISKSKEVAFNTNLTGDAQVKVNRRQLSSAVHNLLDNAIKFTDKGGSITLTTFTDSQWATIRVADTGIGIDPAENPKMFTKFHRGTSVMHYNYKGVGIGLYVTKLIVEQYGGNISFESQLGKGSTFTIKIPVLVAKAS